MKSSQEIFEAIMALPEKDRVLLLERLLEEISPDTSELDDVEFEAELERRAAEVAEGKSQPIPWEEVKKLF